MTTHKIKTHICVMGLGFIGLPTACILANAGYSVLGVDINPEVISNVTSLKLINLEPNLKPLLKNAINSGQLRVSTQIEAAGVYIIAVPTPLTSDNQPDLSYLHSAIDTIIPYLRSQDLILIESTSPIGSTQAIARKLQNVSPEIYIAYCPERVLPGNMVHELIHNDRVVGGINEASTLKAVAFYESFVKGKVIPTDVRTAEAVKLAENTYRDINIAYANELSMIADQLSLNVKELIRLANKHPRVQILEPGPGVGGHCIALNPWFLAFSAPGSARLITRAREVNKDKTEWVIQKVRMAIKENDAKAVVCLGLTYKPDVADLRESPALSIAQALEKETKVLRVDPYCSGTEQLDEAIARADIVVGLVAHKEFQNIPSHHLTGKIVLDFAGLFE
jgi:UDP-N-acetyl-D-mannosaminuronic acid dehydrogenase